MSWLKKKRKLFNLPTKLELIKVPETVMEDILTYETLEDGWEEVVLYPPHVEP